jgi:hypothetical protein
MSKRTSLAEMMGSQAASKTELRLSHLPDILGEAMPELPRDPVGRHRLIRALQQRFGPNFRSLPGLKNLIKEFDDDLDFEKKVAKMKAIQYQPKGG